MWHTVCLAGAVQCTQLGPSLADSLARRMADDTSLHASAVPKRNWRELCTVEKPTRDSDYLIWLSSNLLQRLTPDLEDVSLNVFILLYFKQIG